MNDEDKIICPNCGQECKIYLDEWGYTPFHLHCNECRINIGCTSVKKSIQLLQAHHKKHTYMEYYNGEIKLLYEDGVCLVDK